MAGDDKERITENTKYRASVTILILSLIFVICNTTSIIIWVVVYWKYLYLTSIKKVSWLQLGLIYFSGTTLYLISSILTPLVLVLRGDVNRGVSQYVKAVFDRATLLVTGH